MEREDLEARIYDQAQRHEFGTLDRDQLQDMLESDLVIRLLQDLVAKGDDISQSLQFVDLTSEEGVREGLKRQGQANGFRDAISKILDLAYEEQENG